MALFDDLPQRRPLLTALALSLGAAVALGIARFSYALLLPPMRDDLGWSYLLAGAMNTGNALGYLLGALATPRLLARFGAQRLLIAGSAATSAFMMISGLVTDPALLMAQRILAGMSSAFVFIAGGVLAAWLGALHPTRAGFLIGLYYGGTGLGIVSSAILVPSILTAAGARAQAHGWQWAWLGLGVLCLIATAVVAVSTSREQQAQRAGNARERFAIRRFAFGLSGYFMFGVGYIGYMTFVVALLRQQGMQPLVITVFYTLLGLAVVASSRLWSGMLDRFKGGESLAILNALLGCAAILPALTAMVPVVFVSGLVFGAVFLSVVASTTALVRHNLPPTLWASGISAFTTVFAFGQIVGPTVVGWIADGKGGLERGLIFSAIALFIGAALASRQKHLPPSSVRAAS